MTGLETSAQAIAHEWFNYGVMRNIEAANRYRIELAVAMLKAKNATSQRSGLEWELSQEGPDRRKAPKHKPARRSILAAGGSGNA
jgi:hypothetical protein